VSLLFIGKGRKQGNWGRTQSCIRGRTGSQSQEGKKVNFNLRKKKKRGEIAYLGSYREGKESATIRKREGEDGSTRLPRSAKLKRGKQILPRGRLLTGE